MCLWVANPPLSKCKDEHVGHRMARNTREAPKASRALQMASANVTSGATMASHLPNSEPTCASAVSKSSVSGIGGHDNTLATLFLSPGRYSYQISYSYNCSNQHKCRLDRPGYRRKVRSGSWSVRTMNYHLCRYGCHRLVASNTSSSFLSMVS